jgi:hypothetical protein
MIVASRSRLGMDGRRSWLRGGSSFIWLMEDYTPAVPLATGALALTRYGMEAGNEVFGASVTV